MYTKFHNNRSSLIGGIFVHSDDDENFIYLGEKQRKGRKSKSSFTSLLVKIITII